MGLKYTQMWTGSYTSRNRSRNQSGVQEYIPVIIGGLNEPLHSPERVRWHLHTFPAQNSAEPVGNKANNAMWWRKSELKTKVQCHKYLISMRNITITRTNNIVYIHFAFINCAEALLRMWDMNIRINPWDCAMNSSANLIKYSRYSLYAYKLHVTIEIILSLNAWNYAHWESYNTICESVYGRNGTHFQRVSVVIHINNHDYYANKRIARKEL